MENIKIDLTKLKELVEEERAKPTVEERVEALEMMLLEQLLGGLENV